VAWWGLEAESAWWCVGFDVISHTVDDDVVVVPAEGGEVVGICASALGPGDVVVGLEPVAGDASVGCAAAVAVEDESPKFGWDDPAGSSYCEWLSVGGVDVFD
jgi:hypothetical protein